MQAVERAASPRPVSDNQANGAGPLPPGPPPSPGMEARLTEDSAEVAPGCRATETAFAKRGWTILRKVVSRNTQYGVVWRADMTNPRSPDMPWRLVCWVAPGDAGATLITRPLEMFDGSEAVAPLAP